MGRFVTGNFDWKFAFGDQSSSFGEVLEKIALDCDEVYVNRYIGSQGDGEKVTLQIEDEEALKEFVKAVKKFIGKGFKVKDDTKWCKMEEKFGDEYWDKLMMRKFLVYSSLDHTDELNFFVEY